MKSPKFWAFFLTFATGILLFQKYSDHNAPDLRVFYTAGKWALTDPTKIYSDSPDLFLYPPPAAIFFTLLHKLPNWEWVKFGWYFSSLGIIYFITSRTWAHFLAGLVVWRYFLINLTYGQVNIFVLFLLLLTFEFWRVRAWDRGAFFISFAALLKVFPLVGLFWPLKQRNWRPIFSCASFGALFFLMPLLYFGKDVGMTIWTQGFFPQLQTKGLPLYSHNQSATAFLSRIFGADPFSLFAVGEVKWTLWNLPQAWITVLGLAIGLGVLILSFKKASQRNFELDALSATCFSILFLSHIVWKPYFIFLLPPLIQIFGQNQGSTRWTLFTGLFAFVLLSSPDLIGATLGATLDGASIHLWIALTCLVIWLQIPPIRPKNELNPMPLR